MSDGAKIIVVRGDWETEENVETLAMVFRAVCDLLPYPADVAVEDDPEATSVKLRTGKAQPAFVGPVDHWGNPLTED